MGRRIAVPTEGTTWQSLLRFYIVQRGYSLKRLALELKVSDVTIRRLLAVPKSTTTFSSCRFNPKIMNRIIDILHLGPVPREHINHLAALQAGYRIGGPKCWKPGDVYAARL